MIYSHSSLKSMLNTRNGCFPFTLTRENDFDMREERDFVTLVTLLHCYKGFNRCNNCNNRSSFALTATMRLNFFYGILYFSVLQKN